MLLCVIYFKKKNAVLKIKSGTQEIGSLALLRKWIINLFGFELPLTLSTFTVVASEAC